MSLSRESCTPRSVLYHLLRGTAHAALRLYYAEIRVSGFEHIPSDQPVILVANHANALVDAMLVATTFQRGVCITARATLFESRWLSALLRRLDVIPLLRAQDVPAVVGATKSHTRNVESRDYLLDTLTRGKAVLLFPEGVSHDGAYMVPLRSGTARLALQARASGTQNLHVVPVGLIYETKDHPGGSVWVRFGVPIDMDAWCLASPIMSPAVLTREITRRLQEASLDIASPESRVRAMRFASAREVLRSSAAPVVPALHDGRTRVSDDEIVKVCQSVAHLSPSGLERVDAFVLAVDTLAKQPPVTDREALRMPWTFRALVLMRDGLLVVLLSPFILLGQAVRAVLLSVARYLAHRSLQNDESRDQPAMRTILVALAISPLMGALMVAALLPYAGAANAFFSLVIAFSSLVLHAYQQDWFVPATLRIQAFFSRDSHTGVVSDRHERVRALLDVAHILDAELQSVAEGKR